MQGIGPCDRLVKEERVKDRSTDSESFYSILFYPLNSSCPRHKESPSSPGLSMALVRATLSVIGVFLSAKHVHNKSLQCVVQELCNTTAESWMWGWVAKWKSVLPIKTSEPVLLVSEERSEENRSTRNKGLILIFFRHLPSFEADILCINKRKLAHVYTLTLVGKCDQNKEQLLVRYQWNCRMRRYWAPAFSENVLFKSFRPVKSKICREKVYLRPRYTSCIWMISQAQLAQK